MRSRDLKRTIAGQFSAHAVQYDDLAKAQRSIALDGLTSLSPTQGVLLDIGCGTGSVTHHLMAYSPRIIGLDLAQGMVRYAQEKVKDNELSWLVGDAEQLPIQTASISRVFSSMALQWCMPIEQALSEVNRVLMLGGSGIVNLMIEGSFHELEQCWKHTEQTSNLHPFISLSTLSRTIEKLAIDATIWVQEYSTWHPDVISMLRSIKNIGAGTPLSSATTNNLSLTGFRQLESAFATKYVEGKGLPLTYQVAFIKVKK
jgi:malonyl-CoA O-methyltransferase